MKLLLFDVSEEGTVVSRVLVDKGEFRYLKELTGNFEEQVKAFILIALEERPQKILVEDYASILLDTLKNRMGTYRMELKDDGTVVYHV